MCTFYRLKVTAAYGSSGAHSHCSGCSLCCAAQTPSGPRPSCPCSGSVGCCSPPRPALSEGSCLTCWAWGSPGLTPSLMETVLCTAHRQHCPGNGKGICGKCIAVCSRPHPCLPRRGLARAPQNFLHTRHTSESISQGIQSKMVTCLSLIKNERKNKLLQCKLVDEKFFPRNMVFMR